MKMELRKMKVWASVLLGLIMALTFALIPINIFCVNFPEWVTVVMSVIFCCGLIAYLIVFRTKIIGKVIWTTAAVVVALVCSFTPYLIPYWNSYIFKGYNGVVMNYDAAIPYETAEKDMKALRYHLEKVHPMFKDGLTDEIENLYSQELERLKRSESITVNDLRRSIQIVLHPMRDAHTTTYNNYPQDRYLKTIPQKKDEGYRITAVNGKTTEQIIDDAKQYYSYESEEWVRVDLGSLASLDFYGFSAPYVVEWTNGENTVEERYTESDFVSIEEYAEINNEYVADSVGSNHVEYGIDEERGLAVLTLRQCVYDRAYKECVRNMFADVKRMGIRNVAVDLRGNGGGNSLVGNEFLKYLPVESYFDAQCDWRWGILSFHVGGDSIVNDRYEDLTFDGKVYVLTDSGTFSSAKDFAMLIQDNDLGEIVGQPSANRVNGYGEVVYFHLPNTGLFVQISSKKWYRIDETNTDEYVMPDHPCESEDTLKKVFELIAA